MSTRAVDLQALLFRLQDVQQIQTNDQQQPQLAQTQFAQAFTNQVEHQKEQVQTPNQAEGTKIREEQGRNRGQNSGRRQRERQRQQSEKKEEPGAFMPPRDPASRIDVRV